MTTARVLGLTVWKPEYLCIPDRNREPSFDPLADGPRVRHGPHLEDSREVDAGQRRANRRRAGRQHELVVGLGRHLAGCDVAQLDGLLVRRDLGGLATRSHVDGELGAERVRVRDEKTRFLRDDVADVIGQPAVRVRHVRPAFHHDDLGLFVQPAQASRARGAASRTANDDDFHDSSFSGQCVRTNRDTDACVLLLHEPAVVRGVIAVAHDALDVFLADSNWPPSVSAGRVRGN